MTTEPLDRDRDGALGWLALSLLWSALALMVVVVAR